MAKCEICGKSVTWALIRYKAPDIEGKKHDICKECMEKITQEHKAVKYDTASKKLLIVEPDEIEIRKKCDVCGHIFCYNPVDIAKNQQHATNAALSSFAGTTGAFNGHHAASATNIGNAKADLDRIVDYNRCPKCGSRSLRELTKEEFQQEMKAANAQQTKTASDSPADELKKFKELLDMGVITQEEFDAKKQQLLGL